MLIRSQDKHIIVNFNMEHGVYYYEGVKHFHIETSNFRIGGYSTEEKAIKVLDMIQDAYAKCESVKALSNGTMLDLAGKFNQKQSDDFINDHRATFVFQMPQDDEVKIEG